MEILWKSYENPRKSYENPMRCMHTAPCMHAPQTAPQHADPPLPGEHLRPFFWGEARLLPAPDADVARDPPAGGGAPSQLLHVIAPAACLPA